MLDKLIFYCHYGNGDIFESREFVRDWMELLEAKEYFYAHGKDPKILHDFDGLGFTEVTPEMDMRKPFHFNNNVMMINTWIGRDSRYVLPGIGCIVEMHYQMHNDIRRMMVLPPLRKTVLDYIPDIDYSKYPACYYVDQMLKFDKRRKVLISNGPVQSCQAENFDFNPVIERLADEYKDTLFIYTQDTGLKSRQNLYYSQDVIAEGGRMDLNEISYISTFCDVIVGRNSGPHVFAQVKRNWLDPNKKILSFTYKEIAATFVLRQPVLMKKYWSDRTDIEGVVNKIKEVLDE